MCFYHTQISTPPLRTASTYYDVHTYIFNVLPPLQSKTSAVSLACLLACLPVCPFARHMAIKHGFILLFTISHAASKTSSDQVSECGWLAD